MVPITGAPYSGDEEHYHKPPAALANSLPVNPDNQIMRSYRDSAGRERDEFVCLSGGSSDGPKSIEIRDPVAGFLYVLDMQKRIAYRALLKVVYTPRVSATRPEDLLCSPKINREPLGTQTIERLVANGTKVSQTWPEAPRSGQPRIWSCESWEASELHIRILSKCSDSSGRIGDIVVHLSHISRVEPDPTLFQVPPDFTIVDDSGPINMTYGNQSSRNP